jgi:hypothetical protein
MQPLVQSAVEAANRGQKKEAMELLKQALSANPNDVDAWLVVAAVVDQPERKRQCLNRVLSLDPVNQIARDELLEMDRAAMGGTPSFVPEPDPPQAQPTHQPAASLSSFPTSTSAFESAAAQAEGKAIPRPTPNTRTEKPLVFQSSPVWRITMYILLVVFGCAAVLVASQDIATSLPCFMMAFLMGIGAMAISSKVEITDAGIRASGLISSSKANWSDIKSMKSNAWKRRLELLKSNGEVVNVSTQVNGYPRIVEILRQKRPDLFGATSASTAAASSLSSDSGSQISTGRGAVAPALTGTKTFRKSFIRLYGLGFVMFFFCLLLVWLAFEDPETQVAFLAGAGFCVLVMVLTLFQVSAIKVEPNKLTIESLFEEKVLSARQIKEIKMQSVHGRYGRVTNLVVIIPTEGRKYPLGGFSAGEEVIYGFLTNWWNAHQNR